MSRDPFAVRNELRARVLAKLSRVLTDDAAALCADALMELFYEIDEEWQRIEVTTVGESGESFLDQRWITTRIPVGDAVPYTRTPNRSVS